MKKREDIGKYNTVKKVIDKLGRRPSEQELASFITKNYYDVTEVERGEDDPSANDKIADLVAFYKFDIDDWQIAWFDAQNESVFSEGVNGEDLSVTIFDAELDPIKCSFEGDGCVKLDTEELSFIYLTPENLDILKELIFKAENYLIENNI